MLFYVLFWSNRCYLFDPSATALVENNQNLLACQVLYFIVITRYFWCLVLTKLLYIRGDLGIRLYRKANDAKLYQIVACTMKGLLSVG